MQLVNKLNSYYTNIVRLLQRSRSKIRIINSAAPDSKIAKQNILVQNGKVIIKGNLSQKHLHHFATESAGGMLKHLLLAKKY